MVFTITLNRWWIGGGGKDGKAGEASDSLWVGGGVEVVIVVEKGGKLYNLLFSVFISYFLYLIN